MKTADYNGASVMLEMEPKSEADEYKTYAVEQC